MSAANTFGRSFCVTTFGESHGPAIGCVIDGCPPGIAIEAEDFRHDLDRRATGRSRFTSQRRESDEVEILSGVYQGRSTGTPIALLIRNTDARSKDYGDIAQSFRPGHADYTYWHKYGIRDPRGGGRSSARETTTRVVAAVIAKRYLAEQHGIAIQAWMSGIGPYVPQRIERSSVEDNPLFWPDPAQLPEIEAYLDGLRKSGDSVGARLSVIAENVPVGLGEPIYGKLDSDIAMALMSINAVKAVEIGDGVVVFGATVLDVAMPIPCFCKIGFYLHCFFQVFECSVVVVHFHFHPGTTEIGVGIFAVETYGAVVVGQRVVIAVEAPVGIAAFRVSDRIF